MTVIYLGRPEGPRLRDLNLDQQQRLDLWLTNALRNGRTKHDLLPIEYTRALSTLAKRRGIQFHFDGARKHERHGGIVPGETIPGCVGGSKRKVGLADGGINTKVGQRVEPYHERTWRDDYL